MGKLLFRQIRHSLGRFFAIMAIITLGVGFFTGLRVTQTAMLQTGGEYLDELHFYDFRLISTLGLTTEDVQAVKQTQGVQYAEGAVATDALVTSGVGPERVFHLMSLSSEVNVPHLIEGRLPAAAHECLLDSQYSDLAAIGDELYISDTNSEDTKNLLRFDSYTVVGIASSPLYLNFERGSTALGNGSVSAFAYLPMEGFDSEVYTEIAVRLFKQAALYSDEANAIADEYEPKLSALLEQQAELRYEGLKSDAQAELSEAAEKVSDAEEELAQARDKLNDGEADYAAGIDELEENRKAYETGVQELADAGKALRDSRAQLDSAAAQLAAGKQELLATRAALDESQAQLTAAWAELQSKKEELEATRQTFESYRQQLAELQGQYDGLLALQATGVDCSEQLATLSGSITALQAGLARLEQGLTEGEAAIAAAETELNAQQAALDGYEADYAAADTLLKQQQMQYEAGEQAYRQGAATIASSRTRLSEAAEALTEGEQELADARKELDDGWADLDSGEQELADAKEELQEGQDKLNELKKPDCYTLGRDTNVGYLCYESDTGIVRGISNVFPLFFFMVAALVCITTMTRMVDEERTQIGTLKALGYGDSAILGNYLWYTVLASIVGSVAGFLLGSWIFPKTLWAVYDIMYEFDRPIDYVLDYSLAGLSVAMYLCCSLLATWSACKTELREQAAQLIRPKAPKPGKRIFLERLPFIWTHLRFLHKVSARNVFRFKKRLFMMALGIGGCMALLLTGLGLNDSIQNIVDDQFTDISVYDCQLTFRQSMDEIEQQDFLAQYADTIKEGTFLHEGTYDASTDGYIKSVYMVGAEQTVTEFAKLRNDKGEEIKYPAQGQALINTGLAESLHLRTGDRFTVSDSTHKSMELTVAGIYVNYIYNYIYVTPATYEEGFGAPPELQTAYVNVPDAVEPHEASADWLSDSRVLSVSINDDMRQRVGSVLENLNYIVLLVISCAGALAFIVLYNLTNININERIREIATLKVLGFYAGETASYVFRENLVLTVIGALVGVPLGIWLHRFVMSQIRIDMVSFHVRIAWTSYLLAFVLCFGFTLGVNLIMRRRIRRINMAESLKAAE